MMLTVFCDAVKLFKKWQDGARNIDVSVYINCWLNDDTRVRH